MKRNQGYSMREAEKTFFDACDGTHILHLVEVFERDDTDVTRPAADGSGERWGELWILDEDGYNEVTEAGWEFEGREAVGFDRDELARLAAEPDSGWFL